MSEAAAEEPLLLVEQGGSPGWIERRLLSAVGERLDRLDLTVVAARATAAFGRAALPGRTISVRVEPPAADRAGVHIKTEIRLDGTTTARAEGPASDLDAMATQLALAVARAVEASPPARAEARLRARQLPFSMHRLLGRGEGRAQTGDYRRALLSYERALERSPFSHLETLVSAKRMRLGLGQRRPELVEAALERARDAERRGACDEALAALRDAIRFGAKPRVRWRLALPKGKRDFVAQGHQWWFLRRDRWLEISAASGFFEDRGRARGSIVGIVKKELLTLDLHRERARLARVTLDGRPRWQVTLPKSTSHEIKLSGAGQIAVLGRDRVRWIEESVGSMTRATLGRPLGVGEVGALIERRPGQVALLRPGRTAPTWTASVAASIRDARLTAAKALVLSEDALHVLDVHDGRARHIPAADTRFLGAHGRHAALGRGSEVVIVDVLAGAVRARVIGPDRAVAAHAGAFAVSVAFANGEVLHWDPDGILLDRAQVRGSPRRVFSGPAEAPGPAVETDLEIVAFSDVLPDDRTDMDLLLDAARLFADDGDPDTALELLGWIRRQGAGKLDSAARMAASIEARRSAVTP